MYDLTLNWTPVSYSQGWSLLKPFYVLWIIIGLTSKQGKCGRYSLWLTVEIEFCQNWIKPISYADYNKCICNGLLFLKLLVGEGVLAH